ncbi:hypothetical protein KI387_018031, partial [Taxus chinensis]
MDSQKSEVGIKDERTPNSQKLKHLCNSFHAAISGIYHKRKKVFMVEEDTDSNWPSCKKMRSAVDSSQSSDQGESMYNRGLSSSSGFCGGDCHVPRCQLNLMLNTGISWWKRTLIAGLAFLQEDE